MSFVKSYLQATFIRFSCIPRKEIVSNDLASMILILPLKFDNDHLLSHLRSTFFYYTIGLCDFVSLFDSCTRFVNYFMQLSTNTDPQSDLLCI